MTLRLTFPTAAEAQAAALTATKLKYDKVACLMYDMDDSVVDLYSKVFPVLANITYTDGAGGVVNYRATGALQGHDSFGQVMMDGSNASKFTWANSLAMVAKGWDMAFHSDLHTDANPSADVQLDTLLALATNRYAALGSSYKLRAGIVPSNYADYIPGFIRLGCPPGSLSSQGTAGNLTLLPVFSEDVTFQYSAIPTSGHFMMRRSLTDPGNAPLSVEQAAIDDLVTGTTTNPKIFRCYSHQEVPNITENIFTYVKGKPGDLIWVPSLREFGEYRETRAGTVLTKTVSGTTATFTLDQSALSPDVRWRDLTYRISGGTATSATLTGGRGLTLAGSLLNVYNSDVVPAGIAASVTNGTSATSPTPAPAPTPTPATGTSPATGATALLAYDYSLASSDSNQDPGGYATLFDQATTLPAPNFGFNWLHASSKMRFSFRPQNQTRLDSIGLYDGAGDAAANGYSPIAIWYKAIGTAAVQVGSFTGSQYNVQLPPLPVPAGGVAEWVEFRFVDKNAVFPNRMQFNGAQTDYLPPTYDVVAEQIAWNAGVNSDSYDYVELASTGYGAISEAKLVQMLHFGRNRIYLDDNNLERPEDVQATGPLVRRISPEHHGYLMDDIFTRLSAAGKLPLVSLINAPARVAATWPGYVDNHPYVAANGTTPEQAAQPWLNEMTCTPRAYGTDPYAPASFTDQADKGFQLALRYGHGILTNAALSSWATTPAHSYDPVPTSKLNLGVLKELGFLNEMNESYKGIQQYMRPAELAAYFSAVFDGDKGRLGANLGVKAADPTMAVTHMPPSFPIPHYLMAEVEAAKTLRGYRADGYVDLPWDNYDVHYYPTEATTNQNGVPYQVSPSRPQMKQLRQLLREFGGPQMKCRWSESGYISDSTAIDGATLKPGRSYVPPSASYTSDQRIAHWNVQNVLVGTADGFDGIDFYASNDIAAHGVGALWDQVGKLKGTPTEFHLAQTNPLLNGYYFAGWVQNAAGDTSQASIQRWKKTDQPDIYVVWMPGKAEAAAAFTLALPSATQLTKCVPQDTGTKLAGTTTSISGSYSGTATEQPTFYYLGVPDSSVVTVAGPPAPSASYTTATAS